MQPANSSSLNSVLRLLPSVDELLRSTTGQRLVTSEGPEHAAELARNAIDRLRTKISGKELSEETRESLIAQGEEMLETICTTERLTGLNRVINATGVIIHTNL